MFFRYVLKIKNELESFNPDLLKRPEIIVANKMDLPNSLENLEEFKKKSGITEIIPISAFTKENLAELLYKTADKLEEVRHIQINQVKEEVIEYTYKKPEALFEINKDDDGVYNVTGSYIKKIFDRTDFTRDTSVRMFAKKLRDIGVDDRLRELGVQNGDLVRVLDYEFEFID